MSAPTGKPESDAPGKATDGPWSVEEIAPDHAAVRFGPEWAPGYIVRLDRSRDGSPDFRERTLPDAHLIGASPDMRDALIAAEAEDVHYRDCGECDEFWCDTMVSLHKRANELRRAALTKASPDSEQGRA